MAPLILEGETLGQKHRHYNKLLKEITSKDMSEAIPKINYDEPDIDNLFKIDISCICKDVEYVIAILKCEDMLYVSRALKKSLWLITDKAYGHIVNPEYLHTELLPQMTSKAGHKFLLSIRLNLKDEKRVEQFYNYYEETGQLQKAFKWLSNCSLPFIEQVVKKHGKEIPCSLVKRLCEKSFTIFEICLLKKKTDFNIRDFIVKTEFLLNNYTEKYLDIVYAQLYYNIPCFGPKSTRLIMKACRNVILNNFEKYAKEIHVPTFTKFLRREDVKDFVMKHIANRQLKKYFTFHTMKHFIKRMPIEGRFDFIKSVWIEKNRGEIYDNLEDKIMPGDMAFCAAPNISQTSNAHIYRWYIFAPFDIAFTDLKKLINSETNPSERNAMFEVLMKCTRKNLLHIQSLLQYYRNKHVNESFKFKSHFVNIVLSHSNTHRFDEQTWSILNDIFCSMEVYSESGNNVQSCLKHIIIYTAVHNTIVPDIIENKFEFDTLKSFQNVLNEEEKEKIFNYLYQFLITKMNNVAVNSQSDFEVVKKHVLNVLNLLIDWNKNIIDHDVILEKIRDLSKIKSEQYDTQDLSDIYNIKKSWRKYMFKESLVLNPTSEALVNALKHGPEILTVTNENMNLYDSISSKSYLNKIRTYWPQSLAKNTEHTFLSQFNNNAKINITIQGLCILLPRKQLITLINKYKPNDTKISWGEIDELTLNIQKYFAKYMYLGRPQPHMDLVLAYAKGDYLQYALPSLHSILFNISVHRSLEHIPKILKSPVSLQKHGLKAAFTNLKTNELLKVLSSTWQSTRNVSIRTTVFRLIFDLLCKEQNETCIKEIWHIFSTFIDGITPDENKNIYVILGKASKIPLLIRQDYCIKAYRRLKTLPPKIDCNNILKTIITSTLDIMESMNEEFVAEVVYDSFDTDIIQEYPYRNLISACLLSSKSQDIQAFRYEKILQPFLIRSLAYTGERQSISKYIKLVLQELFLDIQNIVLEKNMITPIKLFNDIHRYLERNMSIEDNYVLILAWKLAADYMIVMDKYRHKHSTQEQEYAKNIYPNEKWDILHLLASADFVRIIMEELKEQTIKYFPSIYNLFSKALTEVMENLNFSYDIQLPILKAMAENADEITGHLLVIEMLPKYLTNDRHIERRSTIFKILASHPSAEVRMPYNHILQECQMPKDYY